MRLSACILSGDDPRDLTAALASLGDVADETVVVVNDDDRSAAARAAAVTAGCRVVAIRWSDDFAAARNAGLDAARGDWVFWLDTDERLLTPDRGLFHRLTDTASVLGYLIDIDDDAGVGAPPRTPRVHWSLYRRREDVRYTGRIHEHFDPDLPARAVGARMTTAVAAGIRIHHHGYSVGRDPQRLTRNVRLLELELRDRPGQLYYLTELGRSLLLLGDSRGHELMAEAAWIIEAQAAAPGPPSSLAAAVLEYALVRAGPSGAGPLTGVLAADLAARWFWNHPPVLWQAARWHYQRGDFVRAAAFAARVLDLGRTGTYDRDVGFDARVFGDETRLNLGACLARCGDLAGARAAFESVSPTGPFAAAAVANLRRLVLPAVSLGLM